MSIGSMIAQAREDQGLTQKDLAERLFVTRQAVSRWETGAVAPGIDMCKLIAITLGTPVTRLLEMPEDPSCQSCGMPVPTEELCGTEADGSRTEEYCTWCYQKGDFTSQETLEEVIEHTAPLMADSTGLSRDEAVSYLTTVLPLLRRWRQET
ncbi:zinc ribbon domain-containing protein [Actinomyces wuliandei]|uniref:zinc ribbon domain-containing protein n=1 Tax=Actinomyces wuliandei TaxID=2057743 RepID=UPI000FDC12E0|nr:zinc ribbon domain-containing protein [Actinomyces wuliandei]